MKKAKKDTQRHSDLFYRNLNIDGKLCRFICKKCSCDGDDDCFLSHLHHSQHGELCVRVNDRYFRSTNRPFATINIFALRICLQFRAFNEIPHNSLMVVSFHLILLCRFRLNRLSLFLFGQRTPEFSIEKWFLI